MTRQVILIIISLLYCFHQNANGLVLREINKDIQPSKVSWLENWKALRVRIKDCVKQSNDTTWNCFKKITLKFVDELVESKEIQIWPGVRFVLSNTKGAQEKSFNDAYQCQELQYSTWFDCLAKTFAKMLETHSLQLNLKEITDSYIREMEKKALIKNPDGSLNNTFVGSARHRRHKYNMLITMVFGVTALGAILVPMGFQMLSIVSGKALLLAKMALLLASINGLKRFRFNQVANSGVHYGLYQVPSEAYGHYYDRGDLHHPRNSAGIAIAAPQPPTLDIGLK